VPPLTFQTLSKHPVADGMFDVPQAWELKHISWAQVAALFVVAPATANLLAKYANGIADDMLTSTLLATPAPVLLAPAMNVHMWQHPATQQNLKTLLARGVHTVGPGEGMLACGDAAIGRMAEPADIEKAILSFFQKEQDLFGQKVLVTAGPTREALDPVRYITNHSSGKMGYAIAEAARARGASVTLVTGPVEISPPNGVSVVPVVSTKDLFEAVLSRAEDFDIIIQAAAPCDFTMEMAGHKMKKQGGGLDLRLTVTPDAAAALGKIRKPAQFIVAFAAETENLVENARKKLIQKNADMVVANDVTAEGAGFSVDTNVATLVTRHDAVSLPLMSKRALAEKILDAAGGNS
jgi:phosphopantothenoylcysteine decarboxylase/phosphopantothenate--cysteine ligase